MYILFLLGRIALVAVFLVSGVLKLMDIATAAKLIQAKVAIPAIFAGLVPQIESASGLSIYQLIAISAGVVELVLALFIVFNLATRFSAIVLLIYLAVTTYYAYDFWNLTGEARGVGLTVAMKNLAIMGALLVLFVIGPWRPESFDEDEDYAA